MILHPLTAIIGLVLCSYRVPGMPVSVFQDIRNRKGLLYTPKEEAEHFNRFQEELDMLSEVPSNDDLSVLFDETKPAIMQSLVDEINSKQNTWTASVDQRKFKGATIRDAKRLCGTFMNMTEPLNQKDYPEEELQDLPNEFDARVGFKECKDVIGHVRDQSDCGSCWAFGPTEAFNDRVCIKSSGKEKALLSPGHMIACSRSFGCNGGFPDDAWRWLYTNGIVTGGDYVDQANMTEADGCWPYNFPQCDHHMHSSNYHPCSKNYYPTPRCVSSCPNTKYHINFNGDRHFASDSSPDQLDSSDSIKKEVMTNGPVSAVFTVYEDFLAYKSGVYKHTSGGELGRHAVKIIGWGNENGEDYWLVVNSWNEEWGDHGLFKIGLTECGIDHMVLAGTPKL